MTMSSYDQWKTMSPDDERDRFLPYDYGEDEHEECDHEEYEQDILTGRAHCCKCPHTWYLSDAEVAAEIERIRSYDEWQRRENRREFWRKLTHPIRWTIYLVLNRIWPRKACSVLHDEEIPF